MAEVKYTFTANSRAVIVSYEQFVSTGAVSDVIKMSCSHYFCRVLVVSDVIKISSSHYFCRALVVSDL